MFADDTCHDYTSDDFKNFIGYVNNRLSLDWCNYNKLSINLTKSEYMLVTTKSIPFESQIYLGNDAVSRKKSMKYLGLNINEDLKCYYQLDHLKIKLSSLSEVAHRLNNVFNYKASTKF